MESEADYLGMGFMNLAGFNIKEPSKLWERMMADKEGQMPEFMGSHPSPENRSKKFLEWENEIVDKFVSASKDKDPTFFWGTKEKKGSVCLKIKKDNLIAKSIS